MKLGIGILIFAFGSMFYPMSIGLAFLQEWLLAILCFVAGASLIILSTAKYLHPVESKKND